jgi:hypothetical protein
MMLQAPTLAGLARAPLWSSLDSFPCSPLPPGTNFLSSSISAAGLGAGGGSACRDADLGAASLSPPTVLTSDLLSGTGMGFVSCFVDGCCSCRSCTQGSITTLSLPSIFYRPSRAKIVPREMSRSVLYSIRQVSAPQCYVSVAVLTLVLFSTQEFSVGTFFFLPGRLLIKAEAAEKPAFGVLRSRTPTAHRW